MADRRSIRGLSTGQLDQLRAAYTSFQNIRDPRGYHFFASLHGLPLPTFCEHGGLLFLPWHRAYLYFFELYLQDAARDEGIPKADGIGIPWWDWTSDVSHSEGIPPAYTENQAGANGNPLSTVSVDDWPREVLRQVLQELPGALAQDGATLRDTDLPDELPRRATVEDILAAPTFEDFSLRLENVHGAVHVWVGGAMSGVATAAYDPIFWSHHAMIDRLWHMWQMRHPGATPQTIMNTALPPFPMTVAQTLNVVTLGYEYSVQSVG